MKNLHGIGLVFIASSALFGFNSCSDSDFSSGYRPSPLPELLCRKYPKRIYKKLISNHNGEVENPIVEQFSASWNSSLNTHTVEAIDDSFIYVDTYDSPRSFILNHKDFFPVNYLKSHHLDLIGGVGADVVNTFDDEVISLTNIYVIDHYSAEHVYHWEEHDEQGRPIKGVYSYIDDGHVLCEKLSIEFVYKEDDRAFEEIYQVVGDTIIYGDYSGFSGCSDRVFKEYYDDFGSVYLIERTYSDSGNYFMYEYEYKYEKVASVCEVKQE
jgi:hypothetical protein